MDAHLINGNYEIQYTPSFWFVKQVINAYEWCLCVLAHERVFAKPTHQLPGPEQTDGIFGMRPGSEEVWILELWKPCIDYVIFMTTWGTWRTNWKMMMTTGLRCSRPWYAAEGPQLRCQVPMERIKKTCRVITPDHELFTMTEERTLPLTQTPPTPS